jgi:hypothetical protein
MTNGLHHFRASDMCTEPQKETKMTSEGGFRNLSILEFKLHQ